MAFTQAADTRLVDGQEVTLTQSEKDAINAEREKNDVTQQKIDAFESEAVTRASAIDSYYDSADKIQNLLDEWDAIQALATQAMQNIHDLGDYYLNTAVERLDELSLSELKDVDPSLDDPFSATPIDPGPWPS